MSFYCEHCNFANTEVQSAGEIQKHGTIYSLKVNHVDDMEREVVKSDTAVMRIEDLDLEIPAGRGKYTQVEGIVMEVLKDLQHGQYKRQLEEPELFEKLDAIIRPLSKISVGEGYPFTITLDDPAGNSWIEPAPQDDLTKKYKRTEYARTPEQNAGLGLGLGEDTDNENEGHVQIENDKEENVGEVDSMAGVEIIDRELCAIPVACPGCSKSAFMNMHMVDIPFFKQVVISALACPQCGYKTSDVKTGGAIPDKGRRIWLEVKDPIDLGRDILKSETCLLKIPACNVEVVPGTMGGRFTTVEGLLTQIRNDLRSSIFDMGDIDGSKNDSMAPKKKKAWNDFFTKLDKAIEGKVMYTILLEDPLASSYVQSLHAPEPDPNIKTEEYERTAEEEEELGLADMKTQEASNGEYVKESNETMKSSKAMNEDQELEDAAKETGLDNEAKARKAIIGDESFKEESTAREIKEVVNEIFKTAQVAEKEKVTEPVAKSGDAESQKVANVFAKRDLVEEKSEQDLTEKEQQEKS